MKEESKTSDILAIAGLLIFGVASTFFENGPIKITCNIISLAGLAFHQFDKRFKNESRKIRSGLRQFRIFRYWIKIDQTFAAAANEATNFKADLLEYNLALMDDWEKHIINSRVYTTDFLTEEDFTFTPGEKQRNQNNRWQECLKHQFAFITGKSGSGKTLQLIKRFRYLAEKLGPGLLTPALLNEESIPVFVELKSLDQELNIEWIINQVVKSALALQKNIHPDILREQIKARKIIYFFDGLDEVDQSWRESCMRMFYTLSDYTGVHVTARQQVFNDVLKNINESDTRTLNNLPAVYYSRPLDMELIKEIVQEINSDSPERAADILQFIYSKDKLIKNLSRPIILNLFLRTYDNLTPTAVKLLETADEEEILMILWAHYVEELTKKKAIGNAEMVKLRSYTIWLANIMGQDAFYVESIQPDWLRKIKDGKAVPARTVQRLFYCISRVMVSAIIGIGLGFITATPLALLSNSIAGGIVLSVVAGIYKGIKPSRKIPEWLSDVGFTIITIIIMTAFCGTYQGFSVPRSAENTTGFHYFSGTESWSGIMLGITLSTIFSYRIILEKKARKYIFPVDFFYFDFHYAWPYALIWGGISGLISGGMTIYHKYHSKNSILIYKWLLPQLNNQTIRNTGSRLAAADIDKGIFKYVFLLTFAVISLIVFILAGRHNDKKRNTSKKQHLNFAIFGSFRQLFFHGLFAAVVIFWLYFVFRISLGLGTYSLAWKISAGTCLLASLWFGGIEVINQFLLRVNLYRNGIAPLRYKKWVQFNQDIAVIIPSGYKMKFYHPTLATYFAKHACNNWPPMTAKSPYKNFFIYSTAFVMILFMLILPFALRFRFHYFWTNPYEITLTAPMLLRENDSVYKTDRSGMMTITAIGSINTGTFVGGVQPEGTWYGFMGMPIGSAYNLDPLSALPHGALLFKTHTRHKWTPYTCVVGSRPFWVNKNDEIQFLTNDGEIENNSGHYQVHVTICDTCQKVSLISSHPADSSHNNK